MKHIAFWFAIATFAAAGFLVWFVPRAFWMSGTTDQPAIRVDIPEEATVARVAFILKDAGVIDSTFGYRLYANIDSSAARPRAGTYRFFKPENYRFIARQLTLGPVREEVELKLIEGRTLEDEAETLVAYGVDTQKFFEDVGHPFQPRPFARTWRDEFSFLFALPEDATLEGYLFPDTYRVWKDQLPKGVIRKQLAEFSKRADRIALDAKAQGRTLHEVVILASIVEKEVSDPEDRKIVAGIFLNRLKDGMALQSDATVNYVTKSGRARSTGKDLEVDSLFNTYRNRGLPPAPISNPGDDALEAALHPRATEYRYFLTDENGKTYFATTFEEHQRNRVRAFSGVK